MPGVVEAERRTRLAREQKARQLERTELLRLVRENRLHEADAYQLETIKLALEIGNLLERKGGSSNIPTDELAEAVKKAIQEGLAGVRMGSDGSSGEETLSRPKMRHVSLTDVKQSDEKVQVQGDMREEEKTAEGGEKLEKLRKLKGRK